MAYARHGTLKQLVDSRGLGFMSTNDFGKTAKSHLLQMRRKEHLVDYIGAQYGNDPALLNRYGVRPYGAEKLANFYTVTFEGLMKLMELYPSEEKYHELAQEMIKFAFNPKQSTLWHRELNLRLPRGVLVEK